MFTITLVCPCGIPGWAGRDGKRIKKKDALLSLLFVQLGISEHFTYSKKNSKWNHQGLGPVVGGFQNEI